jgi:aminoglycoside phosphotransferase (APT) family kinase protein
VTLTVHRDLAELRAGVERWLGRPIGAISRPAPGWSCETIIVDDELVLRLPPVGDGIFPSYDLAQQASVQEAAAASGIAVPSPVTYEPDPSVLGAPFIAMSFVRGPILEEYTPADRWLQSLAGDSARHDVWQSFVETVVAIHAVPAGGLGLRTGLDAELEFWEHYLLWATDGEPPTRLIDALAWCRAFRPAGEPADAGLLWGDVRMGNVVFDVDALCPKAVLDWDMVAAGPIEMDLAWFLALDRVPFDLTGVSVPGFGSHDEAVAVVEGRIGRRLVDLEWYEIFALVRASAVSTRIGTLFERAGQPTLFKPGEGPTLDAAWTRIGEWQKLGR